MPDNYRVVQPLSLWSTLRWIHLEASDEQFRQIMATRLPVLLLPGNLKPMEVIVGGRRVAAAYFTEVAGNVATLGGVRAKHGYEPFAGQLLDRMYDQLSLKGFRQTQALINIADHASQLILSQSGFRSVTQVRQVCKELGSFDLQEAVDTLPGLKGKWSWQPACQFDFADVAKLVEMTFQGSLDCPALNGLRSASEVTAGFLERRAWNEQLQWWLLCKDGTPVACCFMTQHSTELVELNYMGIAQAWRGQSLGHLLVQNALQTCQLAGVQFLTSAVDVQNWPAVKIYQAQGFETLSELAVWLPKSQAQRMVA
jgi:L-amino acid N-acyltransferase YncA